MGSYLKRGEGRLAMVNVREEFLSGSYRLRGRSTRSTRSLSMPFEDVDLELHDLLVVYLFQPLFLAPQGEEGALAPIGSALLMKWPNADISLTRSVPSLGCQKTLRKPSENSC